MKDLAQMSQVGYERFLNTVAGLLHTQRRFIKIEEEIRLDPVTVHYKVKKRGEFHRYLVLAFSVGNRVILKNKGLII